MTINSLYIFDRHCVCVYYQDWHRTRRPKLASEAGLLPAVSQAVSHTAAIPPNVDGSSTAQGNRDSTMSTGVVGSNYSSPRNTLSSSTGTVVAINNDMPLPAPPLPLSQLAAAAGQTGFTSTGLAFDEEAKLVYGVVISLRNMVKKLSGRDEQFTSYRTSAYRLHLFETLSGYKFVMLTDPKTEGIRPYLRRIYEGPFLEYVVRNPLVKMDSREQGIDNDIFRAALDRMVRGLPMFA
ncbi:TRAPP complex subunit bet5 [Coprinellus micaceus]|uniref:Trafficking protein particle complex subunit n=1 Tax=Coprinellus micaceus TaxID=71717 RepID=A0A4Y7TW96_COPMI|nr:TRAPP complex subunit bet5 [Coprinellus micaceus]